MEYTMHVFVTLRRGAPLEDLGKIPVSPKPERGRLIRLHYKGEPAYGMVALIDPIDWEKRPDLIATIHVHMSGEE